MGRDKAAVRVVNTVIALAALAVCVWALHMVAWVIHAAATLTITNIFTDLVSRDWYWMCARIVYVVFCFAFSWGFMWGRMKKTPA